MRSLWSRRSWAYRGSCHSVEQVQTALYWFGGWRTHLAKPCPVHLEEENALSTPNWHCKPVSSTLLHLTRLLLRPEWQQSEDSSAHLHILFLYNSGGKHPCIYMGNQYLQCYYFLHNFWSWTTVGWSFLSYYIRWFSLC